MCVCVSVCLYASVRVLCVSSSLACVVQPSLYLLSVSLSLRLLEEMDRELEHTDSRLRALTSRVQTAIRKSGGQQAVVCVCVVCFRHLDGCGM